MIEQMIELVLQAEELEDQRERERVHAKRGDARAGD